MIKIYYAHIHSHLRYGLVIWGSMMTKTSQTELEKLQKACIRLVNKKKKNALTANSLKLVFSSSYAGCFWPCLLVLLFLRVGSLRLFWGMFVRGCARRDLC